MLEKANMTDAKIRKLYELQRSVKLSNLQKRKYMPKALGVENPSAKRTLREAEVNIYILSCKFLAKDNLLEGHSRQKQMSFQSCKFLLLSLLGLVHLLCIRF